MGADMNFRRTVAFAVAGIIAVATGTAKADDKILVSIPPVHSLAVGLTDGTGEKPVLLLDDASSPHSYALKPSDMIKIEKAELIVIVDEHLEGFLHKPLEDKQGKVLILSEVKDMKTYPLRSVHHHHHDEDEDEHHEEGDVDEHIWLDTDNAKAIVVAMQEELARRYPENKAKYEENKQKLFARLDELKNTQQNVFADVEEKPFLVFHDGWQYFEKQNGLNGVGSVILDEDVLPSVKSRMELAKKVKEKQVKCLFTEPQFDSDSVRVLAEDLKVKTAEIDPLGFNMPKDENLYFDLMVKNTKSIADCLK